MKIDKKQKAYNILQKNKRNALIAVTHILKQHDFLSKAHERAQIQKQRNHNLIEVFKKRYPNEFKICLIEYENKYGKSMRLK